ncbi:MAG: lipase family protein [Pseudomonadota bacterium]
MLRNALTLRFIALPLLFFISACSQEFSEIDARIDFKHVLSYAQRSQVAYETPEDIRRAYPKTVYVGEPESTDVLFFVETHRWRRRQFVTVRGTANLENALQDLTYLRAEDSALGISVHRGFDRDARLVFADLKPHLKDGYVIHVTGHSLGAAISTLLMMYLDKEGYRVGSSINFGQPKLTNGEGADAFAHLKLLRVVDGNDLVPTLPTSTPLDSIGGLYTHLGSELTLLDGGYFAYLDQQEARSSSRGNFWKDLGEESITAHEVSHYLERIMPKRTQSEQVPYGEREDYLKRNDS